MDAQQIRDWTQALDTAELSPITANLPKEFKAGDVHHELAEDNIHRKWLAVEIISGNSGSRWAYWAPWLNENGRYGSGPHPQFKAIADGIFNGDAAHFIGMLGVPYARIPLTPSVAWVLVSPRAIPPPVTRIVEEQTAPRYEKSREVFDVDSQQSRKLP
jgi:hypothetical protein